MKLPLLALTLCLLLCTLAATKAQTEKGRWTVGAQVGNLTYQEQNGGKTFSVSLTPSAGYFIANGLAVGIGVPFSTSTQKSDNDLAFRYAYSGMTIGGSPFIRYFIGKAKLKPYVGLLYTYAKTTTNTQLNDGNGEFISNGKGKITAFVPTLGIAYFVNQYLGLTFGLNYNINHQDQQTFTTTPYSPTPSTYNSDSKSLSLSIGFQLFIGK